MTGNVQIVLAIAIFIAALALSAFMAGGLIISILEYRKDKRDNAGDIEKRANEMLDRVAKDIEAGEDRQAAMRKAREEMQRRWKR